MSAREECNEILFIYLTQFNHVTPYIRYSITHTQERIGLGSAPATITLLGDVATVEIGVIHIRSLNMY